MVEFTAIEISTNLKDELQKKATEKNTNIDNIIKLALVENEELKKKPSNFYDTSKVSSKANKDKDGNIKSYSFSTAIPKPVLNKLGLTKGQLLYWDIDDNKIIITPEVIPTPAPEEESIGAGNTILKETLFNAQGKFYYGNCVNILNWLDMDKPKKEKLQHFKKAYKDFDDTDKARYKNLILYLLDYPLKQEEHEILNEVYEEINK